MHIVSGTLQVFLQPQQHIDTHPLVSLHHVIEHIVGCIDEYHTAHSKEGYPEIVGKACQQPAIDEIAYQQDTHQQHHIRGVEGNNEQRERHRQQKNTYDDAKQPHCLALIATVNPDKDGGEQLDAQIDDKLTH